MHWHGDPTHNIIPSQCNSKSVDYPHDVTLKQYLKIVIALLKHVC